MGPIGVPELLIFFLLIGVPALVVAWIVGRTNSRSCAGCGARAKAGRAQCANCGQDLRTSYVARAPEGDVRAETQAPTARA